MGDSASAMLGCSWVCAGLREDVCWCAMSAEVQKFFLIVQGCFGVMLGCVRDCEEICVGMHGCVDVCGCVCMDVDVHRCVQVQNHIWDSCF